MDTSLNRLADAVLTSTNNLCFGAKIRKTGIPMQTTVYLYKGMFKGVYITWICFPDNMIVLSMSESTNFKILVNKDIPTPKTDVGKTTKLAIEIVNKKHFCGTQKYIV